MIWQFHSTRIFGGEYGSVEENQLEESLDQHEEMRNRIVEANFKWKQAQLMVDYAFKQLNEAVTKWKSLTNIDPGKLEERYPPTPEINTIIDFHTSDMEWPALQGTTLLLPHRTFREHRWVLVLEIEVIDFVFVISNLSFCSAT